MIPEEELNVFVSFFMIKAFCNAHKEDIYLKIGRFDSDWIFTPKKFLSSSTIQLRREEKTNIAAHSVGLPWLSQHHQRAPLPGLVGHRRQRRGRGRAQGRFRWLGFVYISWCDNSPLESFSHKEKVKVRPSHSSFAALSCWELFCMRTFFLELFNILWI